MNDPDALPVAIIGAGPVGLTAAVQLIQRGLPVKVYEAGAGIASNLKDWGHVRVFTPWRYCVDPAARKRLEESGWTMPEPEAFPTADELIARYLEPLARLPELSSSIETSARVVGVSRWGADKVLSKDRKTRPFMLVVETEEGIRRDSARAVIDASGTWQTPNPLGAGGVPAEGEAE
ncbi:MAG: FAD-dependent oxidoreductase, partial [Mesorhizobium sp.]